MIRTGGRTVGSVPSTVERLTHVDDLNSRSVIRRERWVHRFTIGLLTVILGLAVLDLLDVFDTYGVGAAEVRAAGDGVTLVVEYPSTTRPALASPFRIRVERDGGFDGPITIALSRPWIEIWDLNGVFPNPSSETGDDEWVEWEFDPPDGPVFEAFIDWRMEPAKQESQDGVIELRDETGDVLATVDVATTVRP